MTRAFVLALLATALCAACAVLTGCGGGTEEDLAQEAAADKAAAQAATNTTKTTQPVDCTANPKACT